MVGEVQELTIAAAKRSLIERMAARIHSPEEVKQYAEAYKLLAEAEAHESATAINRQIYHEQRRNHIRY